MLARGYIAWLLPPSKWDRSRRYPSILVPSFPSTDIYAMFAFEGFALEVALTTANSAAQAWYGYDQVRSFHPTQTSNRSADLQQGIIAGILVSERFLDTFPIIKKPVIEGTFTSIFSVGSHIAALGRGTPLIVYSWAI